MFEIKFGPEIEAAFINAATQYVVSAHAHAIKAGESRDTMHDDALVARRIVDVTNLLRSEYSRRPKD